MGWVLNALVVVDIMYYVKIFADSMVLLWDRESSALYLPFLCFGCPLVMTGFRQSRREITFELQLHDFEIAKLIKIPG